MEAVLRYKLLTLFVDTAYTVDTVDIVDMVCTVDTVYSIENALHC